MQSGQEGKLLTSRWTGIIRTQRVLKVSYLYHHHSHHCTATITTITIITTIITMETITIVTITTATIATTTISWDKEAKQPLLANDVTFY